jgi:predicted DNA-binding protein (UPF0251 family)
MARQDGYDITPATRHVPLRLDEVEALQLNGARQISRDEAAIIHFLSRVAATLKDNRKRLADLQSEMDRTAIRKSDSEHPMTRALKAISELDDEGRRQLLDIHYLAAVDEAERFAGEAEKAQIAAINEMNRARFALNELLADPLIPADIRDRIGLALTKFA